jgi:hypothetical protein
MMTASESIVSMNAHTALITDFEQATVNNQLIIFSGSKDGCLKAWRLD